MTHVALMIEMIKHYIKQMSIKSGEAINVAMVCRWAPKAGYPFLPTRELFDEAAEELISVGILTRNGGKYFVV
ncbi:hypothetical protein [Pluralibacter gergoviae]